jgi:hypothetical protein
VNEKAGQSLLRRRHPLTIEGDEIGSFDIVLACAGNDTYDMTYLERRRGVGAPLKQVSISVGRRSMPLKIVTSEIKETEELASLARAVVPANLFETLAREGSRSLMVTTSNSNDVATTIRVGNSGLPQNLPQLVASCANQSIARSDAHAELAPAKAAEAGIAAAPK